MQQGKQQYWLQTLKATRWYKNPFAISGGDYRHACSLAANVLKEVIHEADRYHIQGPPSLTAEIFWLHLLPLIAGDVHTPKQRVQELGTMMTCNLEGATQPAGQ
jgi:hypothetical protein